MGSSQGSIAAQRDPVEYLTSVPPTRRMVRRRRRRRRGSRHWRWAHFGEPSILRASRPASYSRKVDVPLRAVVACACHPRATSTAGGCCCRGWRGARSSKRRVVRRIPVHHTRRRLSAPPYPPWTLHVQGPPRTPPRLQLHSPRRLLEEVGASLMARRSRSMDGGSRCHRRPPPRRQQHRRRPRRHSERREPYELKRARRFPRQTRACTCA